MTPEKTELLKSFVGKYVRLNNRANEDMEENKVAFMIHGTLEYDADDGSFFVRCKECYNGSSGISFKLSHIETVFLSCARVPSIVLK